MILETIMVILIIFLFLRDPKKSKKALKGVWKRMLSSCGLFLVAIFIAWGIFYLLNSFNIDFSFLGLIETILLSIFLGFVLPGPRYIIYPIVYTLSLSAYANIGIFLIIMSQQILSFPEATLLEIKYFGKKFTFYRMFASSVILIFCAFVFNLLYPFPLKFSFETTKFSIMELITLFPVLIFAVILADLLEAHIHKRLVEEKMGKTSLYSVIKWGAVGIGIPGPIHGLIPIFGVLRKKGASFSNMLSLISGQTAMGPIRFFMEVAVFGWYFVFVRFIIAILFCILIGITSKKIKKY